MSLADELFEANQSEDVKKDELGIPIVDNIDYLLARTMVINQKLRPNEFSVYQLHLRGKRIYKGHEPIEETQANIVRLAKYSGKMSFADKIMFWERLKTYLPSFNKNIIQLSENLFWDKPRGMIIGIGEIKEKYGKGSQSTNGNREIPKEEGLLCD